MTSEEAQEFFTLPENLKEQKPTFEELQVGSDKKMKWPICNFVYSAKQGVFVAAACDLDEAAQMAKGATNYSWPCCKAAEDKLRKPMSEISLARI